MDPQALGKAFGDDGGRARLLSQKRRITSFASPGPKIVAGLTKGCAAAAAAADAILRPLVQKVNAGSSRPLDDAPMYPPMHTLDV